MGTADDDPTPDTERAGILDDEPCSKSRGMPSPPLICLESSLSDPCSASRNLLLRSGASLSVAALLLSINLSSPSAIDLEPIVVCDRFNPSLDTFRAIISRPCEPWGADNAGVEEAGELDVDIDLFLSTLRLEDAVLTSFFLSSKQRLV